MVIDSKMIGVWRLTINCCLIITLQIPYIIKNIIIQKDIKYLSKLL